MKSFFLLLVILFLVTSTSSAIVECVGPDGDKVYRSSICPAGYKMVKDFSSKSKNTHNSISKSSDRQHNMSSFQAETARATKALKCLRPEMMPAGSGFGALYGCIAGSSETVKFFINEAEGTGQVENVKLMWNDWFIDIGYGLHADKKEAMFFIKAFAKLYASNMEKKLMLIFFSNFNTVLEVGDYQIAYTYNRGPKIDERLLTLTPKAVLAAQKQLRNNSVGEFNACKDAVSKAVGYPASQLSGDGKPIQESGYKSYMIEGRGKDMFFCEVYSGGRYKIKAALNGKYPFKYIAEGEF